MSQSLELRSSADSQVSLLLSKLAWLTAMGQIACCTNKCLVGSEIIVVHAVMEETAMFSRSSVTQLVLR